MEKWLDLLTPSAAALSLLLAIALVIQAIRHGRSVRRLESRLAEREGAAARVSLDRLTQLQRRAGTSTGLLEPRRQAHSRPVGPIVAVLAVVGVVAGTGWYLFMRDAGSGDAGSPASTRTTGTPTTARPQSPSANNQVPTVAPNLDQPKSAYTVLVLNGSGVAGAAGNLVPVVQTEGWNTAPAGNASSFDEKTSFVMYLPGKEAVADNLAIDLGIKRKQQADGVEISQDISDVDAIVVIGLDLATRRSP